MMASGMLDLGKTCATNWGGNWEFRYNSCYMGAGGRTNDCRKVPAYFSGNGC